MKEIDRRTFIKFGVSAVVGVVVEGLVNPIKPQINNFTERVTGLSAGNASLHQQIEDDCKNSPNPQECIENYEFSLPMKAYGIVVAPIQEEIVYRGMPSYFVSDKEGRQDPVSDILLGTGGIGMTRRELLFGGISSVIFGAVHNVTNKGIDLKTIPASQTFGGAIYWYLQRKLGIFANIFAHMTNNIKALSK